MDSFQNIFKEMLDKAAKKANENLSEDEMTLYLDSLASDFINETIPEIADAIVLSLNKESENHLKLIKSYEDGFVYRNIERWKSGFNALEILIITCSEIGEDFNSANRDRTTRENNVKFDTLVRLHARACHISSEILWLLKGGFADGAHARWRALHEVVVTALFLSTHENELSIRYRQHEVVESYKGMTQYNHYEPRLNIVKFSEEELIECKLAYDELLGKYGQEFKTSYGWAAKVLNNKKPNFFNLEEAVDLDHLRPYYKWASQNIHANAHGINSKLGLAEAKEDVLLAGASNSGMTDPAQLTALSLSQISVGLLTMYSNMDSLITQYVIKKLSADIGELFWEANCKETPL